MFWMESKTHSADLFGYFKSMLGKIFGHKCGLKSAEENNKYVQ